MELCIGADGNLPSERLFEILEDGSFLVFQRFPVTVDCMRMKSKDFSALSPAEL
jgi:hypothetical protein